MISIITPSIGRETIKRTFDSIDKQSSDDYEHIVVFDGIEPTIDNNGNPKRKIYKSEKLGANRNINGMAGKVRNYAFNFCQGDYIGFVDDDDTLSPEFVKTVHEDFKEGYDFIVYTMREGEGGFYPHPMNRVIAFGNVGISFVFKKELLLKYDLKFENSDGEDFLFLKNMKNLGLKHLISPKVMYLIRQ